VLDIDPSGWHPREIGVGGLRKKMPVRVLPKDNALQSVHLGLFKNMKEISR